MVTLTNIVKNNELIECDYNPEDSDHLGHIIVFQNKKLPPKIKYSDYQYGKNTYANHVVRRLIELFDQETIPEKDIVMWY